ncbi:hypothetical protein [Silvibacterium acidisoli]|uniref:hypothetical protein n=1 Tax=Acidobacteriaceae bacterium ZG23-2 TaxID=2883246 RepID=UPI00406CEA61
MIAGDENQLRANGLKVIDRTMLLLLQLYGVIALICLAITPHFFLPSEDAVILLQYSRNLAQHGAITFLTYGPHAEGATDFAWMIMVAAAQKIGVAPFWFCALSNIVCLLLLGLVLARLAGVRATAGGLLAVTGAAALFPQIFAAAFGFAVLPDALLLSLLVMFTVRERPAAASLAALVLCLMRPDGVVFVLPLLLFLILQNRRAVPAVLLWFVLPGVTYFLWRWHYFGGLFPLPFLVKGTTPRTLGLVVIQSVRRSLSFLAFGAVVLVPFVRWREGWNRRLLVSLVLVPTMFYWAMRLDQNVGFRFYYYLPLATALLLALNWQSFGPRKVQALRVAFVAWLVLFAMPLSRELRTFRDEQFTNVKQIATELGKLPQPGSMLVTEAGFLPYYSGWTVYDAWGLNTAEFAHRFIQPDDVTHLRPEIVVLHPDPDESCLVQPDWPAAFAGRTWKHMTRNLTIGATGDGYELWLLSYGSEYHRQRMHWQYGQGDRECWFVRRDAPQHDAITRVLAANHAVGPPQSLAMEQAIRVTTEP